MTIVYFFIALGVLIFIHELGHFLVAKKSGIKVEVFSLGFGPRLIGFQKGETDYRLSLIPMGGYVKMLGEEPAESSTKDPRSYAQKSVATRCAVIFCGPLMNIVLAALLMPIVFMIGKTEPKYLRELPVVQAMRSDAPAQNAGFHVGDTIVSIDGKAVKSWEAVQSSIIISPNTLLNVTVSRDGSLLSLPVTPATMPEGQGGYVGFEPSIISGREAFIESVRAQGVAAKAGIQSGDLIVAMDGKKLEDWYDLSLRINASEGKPCTLTVERAGKTFDVTMTPEYDANAKRWLIGVVQDRKKGIEMVERKFGIVESVVLGMKENVKLAGLTFGVLKRLFSFQLSYKVLGGPVMIAKTAAAAAHSGLSDFFYFLSFLSLQLGMLNLLPVPVLDGGQLVFLAIEALRKKALSEKVMAIAQNIGFVMLLSLMLLVTYSDIDRFWSVGRWLKQLF